MVRGSAPERSTSHLPRAPPSYPNPTERTELPQRLLSAVLQTLRALPVDDRPETAVHFHSDGPAGQPAPCFTERCARPRLDVD